MSSGKAGERKPRRAPPENLAEISLNSAEIRPKNAITKKLEPPVRVNGGGSFSLVRMTRLTQLARGALVYFFFLAAFFLVAFFTAFLAVFFFAAFFLATVHLLN